MSKNRPRDLLTTMPSIDPLIQLPTTNGAVTRGTDGGGAFGNGAAATEAARTKKSSVYENSMMDWHSEKTKATRGMWMETSSEGREPGKQDFYMFGGAVRVPLIKTTTTNV